MTPAFDSPQAAVEFSLRLFELLRHGGVTLGTMQTLACTQAIAHSGTVNRDELMWIYRATLINRKNDLGTLHRLFSALWDLYFSPSDESKDQLGDSIQGEITTVERHIAFGDPDETEDEEDESTDTQGYSTQEVDHHKDFHLMPQEEFPAVLRALEKIATAQAAVARRKVKRSKSGRRIDLRSSIRDSVRSDGDILTWRFKDKVPTHTRLVLVVDVSGSMEAYGIFLLNFVHSLHKNHRLKIEVFVFSTELQPLTQYFRMKNFRQMLDNVSVHFSGWSGGTKIGQAVRALNDDYASVLTAKTLVTIMSDGWDTGEKEVLDREMQRLARRTKSIVWINPLKGDPSYEPLAIGMATALPYCDEFISGHSIESLKNYAELIG